MSIQDQAQEPHAATGKQDYRAYVGSPKRYDLTAAMVFNLLTCLGLRQLHRLIDVGCGSLRVGRLLIRPSLRSWTSGSRLS